MPPRDDPRLARYSRQMLVSPIGDSGQRRLLDAHAVVVGVGALGCVIADLLARAGVGRLTIIDRDLVDRTNLQRQTLFTEADSAERRPKAIAASQRLREVNTEITIDPVCVDLTPANAAEVLGLDGALRPPPGVILDGTDNFTTRYLLNDCAVSRSIPLVYGGAISTRGMQATFRPPHTACLRCVFPDPPDPGVEGACDTVGVLAPVTSIIGAVQAAEALKILTGATGALSGSLLSFDLWSNTRARIDLTSAKDPACPCCALGRLEYLESTAGAGDTLLCGGDVVQLKGAGPIDLDRLASRLYASAPVTRSAFALKIEAEEGVTLTVFPDGRTLVAGAGSAERAKSLHAGLVGA